MNGIENNLELVWMNPRETKPNPMNWRKHPPKQTQIVESLIFGEEKVGWAGAALFNKTTGHLIDGHDRRGLAIKHNAMMPVLVGNWTESQEKLILTTLDQITGMAVTDEEMLDTLMRDIHVMDKNITQMLADMAENEGLIAQTVEVDNDNFTHSAETYMNSAIRQIVLYYDVETHKKVFDKLLLIGKNFGIDEDNSETVLKLIEFYEAHRQEN